MTPSLDDITRMKHLAINLQLELSRINVIEPDMSNIIARLNKISAEIYEESFKIEAEKQWPMKDIKKMLSEIAR